MNEKNIEKNIQNKTLDRIREGKVRMRPRFYFVLRLVLTIVVAVLALMVSVFVISFIFFSIHESGEQFLLGFGGRGVLTFISLFPWTFLVLDIAVLFLLEWLIRGFKFGYRISVLNIFVAVFLCSTVLGVLFNLTPVHGLFLDRADKGELPFIGDIYESIHDSHSDKGVFRGTIISLDQDTITIAHDDNDHDADDGTRVVILPQNHPVLQVGDDVYVFGLPSNNQVVQAQGVEKLDR